MNVDRRSSLRSWTSRWSAPFLLVAAALAGCDRSSSSKSGDSPARAEPQGTIRIEGSPRADVPAADERDSGTAKASPQKLPAHVAGKNFALDLELGGGTCRAGAACELTVKLVADAGYHINKEYPYKFVGRPSTSLAFVTKGEGNTFSRAAGDFREIDEKTATMTVRFKPASAGSATLEGTYKMSVCSSDQCQIEQQPISAEIPVI